MAQEIIDFGAYPNDPDSDAIRVAFQKTQNNFNELFSIQYQTGVSQIIEGSGISVNVNTGNVTVTNRIANVTIQTDANLRVGVTTATSNTATINSGTTPFVINLANTIRTGNITATGNLQGRLNVNSSSQPNITSVGDLTNLSVIGNIRSNNITANTFEVVSLTATYLGSPGTDQQVLFNSLGNVAGSPNLTFTGNLLTVTGIFSSTGNIEGQNIATLGNISATGNIRSNANIISNRNLSAVSNVVAGNFVGRFANGTSNIFIPVINGNINVGVAGNANILIITNQGANINGYANITGEVGVGSLTATNTISAAGSITGASLNTSGAISATSNVTGGNLLTSGNIVATQTVIAGNINTSGAISATSNVTGGNLLTSGAISATGNISSNVGVITNGIISAAGNITGNNISTRIVSANGNIQGANLRTTGTISATGNLIVGNATLGNLAVANFFSGNGNALFSIQGANVIGAIPVANLAMFVNITETANANVINYIPFVNTTSGNADLITDSFLSYNSNSKVLSANALSVTGSITSSNFITPSSGRVTTRNLSTGANTTTGTITGNWTLTSGSLLQSTYADLAEYYSADQYIEPGTVVEFGGTEEVTICKNECSNKVAGVVSSNPAYVMNSMIDAKHPVAVALQGRVPVKVTGKISKGDMLVSAGNGLAKSDDAPPIGTVLGKSLVDFDGDLGTIEIAVGRL